MYKLFIVDDEIDRIEAIKTLIPWNDYQIEVCGQANNGMTAFGLIKELLPDIIISDIRMPIMDGLELFKKLKQENIKIKGIILSGYDDFEYAKKAINLNVIEYLLKPCKPGEIIEAVVKARKMVEQELTNNNILKSYKVSYDESLCKKRSELLKALVLGKDIKSYDVENNAQIDNTRIDNIQIDNVKKKSDKLFLILIFSIDNKNKIVDYNKVEEVKSNIIILAKKHFINGTLVECLENSQDIICIMSIDKNYYNSNSLSLNINNIKAELGRSLTVGIGSLVKSIKDINQSYNIATQAIDARFFLGENRIINLKDINPYNDMTGVYPINEELDIINCLSTGNKESLITGVENFYNKLCADKLPSKKYIQKITISFCSRIYKFCIDKNINVKDTFDSELEIFDKLEECETIMELKIYICCVLNNIIDKINEVSKKNVVITTAVEYIMKNYNKEISLEVVSKELYISTGYLSLLFKQEMKVNFIDFISNYRIDKAKELLKDNSLKNYQVARQVGFNDEKYFSQLFKKHTGVTPTQYRQK